MEGHERLELPTTGFEDQASIQLMLMTHGATGRIRTYGFRDLQSLALGHSATVALFDAASAYTPFNSVTTETEFGMVVTYPPEKLIHTQQSHTILWSRISGSNR